MKIFLSFLSLFFLSASFAGACGFDKPAFGSTTEQIISKYKFDLLEVKTEGEEILAEHGKVICDTLPEESMLEFTFIDDSLVKIHIQTPNKSEELLKYSQATFGESDDKDRSKSANNLTSLALWGNKEKYSVIYSSNPKLEKLDISSKNHKNLFDKISKQRGKAIDDELKAKGLGKYSNNSSSTSPNENSGATKNYDNDALKDLKRKYDRAEDAYKSRQK